MGYASRTVTQAIQQLVTYTFVYFGLIKMVGVSLEVSPK